MTDVFSLNQPGRMEEYLNSISPERQKKALGFKSMRSKSLSVGAEVLLQKAVLKSFGISEQLKIIKGEHGKPALRDHPNIHFNISHSGNFVACALSSQSVGVDIEQIGRVGVQLAKRFFHQEEVAWILAQPVEKQQLGLCDLWSIKESYMKYIGKGFTLPMNAFFVKITGEFPENLEVTVFEEGQKKDVFIKKYQAPENYELWCSGGSNQFEDAIEWVSV